jgi:hypothetical protein
LPLLDLGVIASEMITVKIDRDASTGATFTVGVWTSMLIAPIAAGARAAIIVIAI